MKEMDIKSTSSCTSSPNVNSFQYSFNEVETEFVRQRIENLIRESIIAHTKHESGELVLTIFVRLETDSGMRFIFNKSALHLVRPNIFLAKLDKKDA